ncbi:MAG TPA: PIN-like domain-containing protein [Candidatus Paceibacterota bacterium]|nr:PIN-like domain-containing protein [Candidatus Paceibacterota bacterium]
MADKDQRPADVDPLLLAKVFPAAHEVFQFKPKSLDEVFQTAIFVLDTNALLVPYSVGKTSLDDIGKRYKDLIDGKRLFVPAHVAREFAHQRAERIKNLFSALSKARNQTRPRTDYSVLLQMPEYQGLAAAEKDVDNAIAKRDEELDKVLGRIRSWKWDDPVSDLYRTLFTADVVVESDLEPDAAKSDAKQRLDGRVPPGYRDADKPVNSMGDIFIWHVILTLGRKRHQSDLVLISGDAKNDWLYRSESTALYPRFELTDEYRRASEGGSFNIVTFTDFLRRLEAPATVVDEVQVQEVLSQSERPRHHWGFQAETAVARWLINHGYQLQQSDSRRFPDFVARKDGTVVGIEVKLVSSKPLWSNKLAEIAALSGTNPQTYERLEVFFVALEKRHADIAHRSVRGGALRDSLDRPIEIRVGYLDAHGEFALLEN